jgi:hypothetical protein
LTTLSKDILSLLLFFGVGLFVFGAISVVLRPLELILSKRWRYFRRRSIRRTDSYFSDRGVLLHHDDDEALRALGVVTGAHLPIFDPQRSARFLANVVGAAVVLSIGSIVAVGSTVFPDIYWKFWVDVWTVVSDFVERVGRWLTPHSKHSFPFVLSALIVVCFALYMLIRNAIFFIASSLERSIGKSLSTAADKIVWDRFREIAFGNDVDTEVDIIASASPFWSRTIPPFQLPTHIAEDITVTSDLAVARSVGKLRREVERLMLMPRTDDPLDGFASYLSWEELIHTTYFKVPLFRKLVCYAISQSPGFGPSEKFRGDPDYARLRSWLAF